MNQYGSIPKSNELAKFRKELRRAVADYMQSEGCSCCRDIDGHEKHLKRLAKLLNVRKYIDGSGYNFNKHCTKPTVYEPF